MTVIPLEDFFNDIISKAIRGLKLDDAAVAAKAGISLDSLTQLKSGEFSESAARAVAPILRLNADALVAAGLKTYRPAPVEIPGLMQFNTPFEDMTVNSYLVWDKDSREAIAFDTGADCQPMLDFAKEHGLKIKLLLLTHTHGDHIFDLDRLKENTGCEAYVGEREPIAGATSFHEGESFTAGDLVVETRLTWGHSKGGITYVVHGLDEVLAVVGDAIFAGSMGGGGISYADAIATNRQHILSLSNGTIVCPGHGPMTTVGQERKHNPFFA